MFWTLISFFSLLSIIILQVLFVFLNGINPHIRDGIDTLLVPLLLLFVVSIFWRSSTATILSLAGVLCLDVGMFYEYDNLGMLQATTPHIANRLGYGVKLTTAPVVDVADLYFFMGIFALILCTAIALRPSLFRAKGTPVGLPHSLWTNDNDPKLRYGATVVS